MVAAITQPPFAGDKFAYRRTFSAMRTTVDRAVPARFLADPHAIGDLGRDGAADGAVRADALADRHLRAGGRRRSGLGSAHAGKRQRAQRPETTGDETRAAQEGAAVEAAIHLAGEKGEVPAPDLTLRPLD